MAEVLILDSSNPYASGRIYRFEEGDEMLQSKDLNIFPDKDDEYHTVRIDDTLDKIADIYYAPKIVNASRYWWVIAIANDIGIDEPPLDLSAYVGLNILVPDIYRIKLLLQ